MTKILVAYFLSLFGYPVWQTPVDAPASTNDSVVLVAKVDPAPAPAPRARRAPARPPVVAEPVVEAKPEAESAKTDAGSTTPAATPPAAPAVTTADAGTAPVADAALAAADIVARVQGVYDGTTSFQANFRQVFRHRLNPDRSKEATGVVYLQKPGKMRWEYHDPERKLIVSDGTTLWAYEPSEDQVFEQSLENTDLPTAVTFLLGSGSLSGEFDARLIEEGSDTSADRYVIELRPKTPSSQFARLLLVVKRTDFHVLRTVVIDHSGNTNSIEFAGEVLNSDIPASQFRFVRPEGARIIR
jgi:outer membrane lipoprotein carrier protein